MPAPINIARCAICDHDHSHAYGDPDVWAIQPNMIGDPGGRSIWGGSMGSADPGLPILPNPEYTSIKQIKFQLCTYVGVMYRP